MAIAVILEGRLLETKKKKVYVENQKVVIMSVDPTAPMTYVDEDASSGSGDDGNMLDGHNKRQSSAPSASGRRKRSRKATGDAIVDAMLEIAAANIGAKSCLS